MDRGNQIKKPLLIVTSVAVVFSVLSFVPVTIQVFGVPLKKIDFFSDLFKKNSSQEKKDEQQKREALTRPYPDFLSIPVSLPKVGDRDDEG